MIYSREVRIKNWAGTTDRLREVIRIVDEAIEPSRQRAVSRVQEQQAIDGVPRSVQALIRILLDERVESTQARWQVQISTTDQITGNVISGPSQNVLAGIEPEKCEGLRISVPTNSPDGPFISVTFDREKGVTAVVGGDDEGWTAATSDAISRALQVDTSKYQWMRHPAAHWILASILCVVAVIFLQPLVLAVLNSFYAPFIPGFQSSNPQFQQYNESVAAGMGRAAKFVSWAILILLAATFLSNVKKFFGWGMRRESFRVLRADQSPRTEKIISLVWAVLFTVLTGMAATLILEMLQS